MHARALVCPVATFFFYSWGTELLQAAPTLIRNRGEKPSLRGVIPFLLCVFSGENKAASVYREPTVDEGYRADLAVNMTAPPLLHLWTELREHQFTFQLLGRQMKKLRPRGKEEDEKTREALGSPQEIEGRLIKRKELSENLNILQRCLC